MKVEISLTISQGIWHRLRDSSMNLKRESVESLEKRLAVHISWLQIQLGSVIEMSEQDLHRAVLLRVCGSFIKILRKKPHFLFNFPVTFNIIHFKIINIHFCALDDPCLPFCHGPWTLIKYIYMKGAPWKHPEGTSNGSDICDFLKVSDFNGSLWNVKDFPLKII